MVHKKYIKRDGRIFGPYLYENYRENGVVKTRYLGKGKDRARISFKVISVIAIVLIFVGLLIYSNFVYEEERVEDEEGLFNIFDWFNFFQVKPVSVFVEVAASITQGFNNVSAPFGIYEPLCCDNNLKTGYGCLDYVDLSTGDGAYYCDTGDPITKRVIQHRMSIIFENLTSSSGDFVECVLETSGTQNSPGNLFVIKESVGIIFETNYSLNYTFNRSSDIKEVSGSPAPWYLHNCSLKDSGENMLSFKNISKRIYVHNSTPWTDTDLTQLISCEGGTSGVFMNNIEKCLRSSPTNAGSSKEYLYGFNMYGGATVEGICYDGMDSDGASGIDGADDTCKGWWDNYVDRSQTLLPGYSYGTRSEKGGFFSDSYIYDADNLNSLILPSTGAFVEHTVNVNPSGFMKFRFKDTSMESKKYNIFLYEVPNADTLSVIGHGPGISSLTSDKLKVTLQSSGKYTVNLICDNSECDDGGVLDIVLIVNFTSSLSTEYNLGVEFTFTAGSSDSGINTDVYFDSEKGLRNTNESDNSSATAENLCNDSKNNDLDISFDYDYINTFVLPPNKIEYSRDCVDANCHEKQGPPLRGVIGVCYYKNESLNYPSSCSDGYDNDWNDNFEGDIYGITNPNANYTDCHDLDCFGVGGLSSNPGTDPCPFLENNSVGVDISTNWCGDGLNNDWDYIQRISGSGTHTSSCIFSSETYNRVEPNSEKYSHSERYALFDCMDFDCEGYDGNNSMTGLQKCEYGREINCNDNFDNDALQVKDCDVTGSAISDRKEAIGFSVLEYDCKDYCRANVDSSENGVECVDGRDNDWDFWYSDPSSSYFGIENNSKGGGMDCRWLDYNPDENCNLTWMNVAGVGSYEQSGGFSYVQCQLGKELNCSDNFDNDIDRDSSNVGSGWEGNNDDYRTYNVDADCADYDCYLVQDSVGNYIDTTGTYACPINERYRVNSGVSFNDTSAWCFDDIDNDLDGDFDCNDGDCLNAVNPSPGQNGLNSVLRCAAYELNASALLDEDIATNSTNYCGNILDDESKPGSDNFAFTIGGVDWENIDYNSINQQIQSQAGVSVMDCSDDDCYRKFRRCAPCSSNESVEWDSCFDSGDNDWDGLVDENDEDCQNQIMDNRGYNATNKPSLELTDGSCMNQYDDDGIGFYNHPVLECRNEQIECAGLVFSPDGRVCPNVYTEESVMACSDDLDNDGNNGLDCYDSNCFSVCGISGYGGGGRVYHPQNASSSVGVVNLVYAKITRLGLDFYYTYEYAGSSNGESVYLDLGHSSDSNQDINSIIFDTTSASIAYTDCSSCGFSLSTSQPGFLRITGTSKGSGFKVTVKIPSQNALMNLENVLAASSIGAAPGSSMVSIEVVNNVAPVLTGLKVEPDKGNITVGDPIYMRGHNFVGSSDGQSHSGQAGWCKIEVTGGITDTLDNPNGASEKACTYITTVDAPGIYNFVVTPYDSTGNAGASVSESLQIKVVTPKIISALTRAEGKRVFFSASESYNSFEDVFNGQDGLLTAQFKTDSSNPYTGETCYGIIRDEDKQIVSVQKIRGTSGATATCIANVSLEGLGDGLYTVTVNTTDGQGYSLETQKLVFFVCSDLNSKGSSWDCRLADFDVDGYTEGIFQPFNFSNGISLYPLVCDSCNSTNNTGMDTDGDGIDNACDTDSSLCGNGILEFGEECDEGSNNSNINIDACRTNCKNSWCGDGVTDSGEECDDSNSLNGDGCSSVCVVEGGGDLGGGGGGSGIGVVINKSKPCTENWTCGEFSNCGNLIKVFELGEIDEKLKKIVEDGCAVWKWNSEFCGVQRRECYDRNNCNTSVSKPDTVKECYYIEEEKPVVIVSPEKPDYILTCLILLILVSLLVVLEEYLFRKYLCLRKKKFLNEKDRNLKREYLTLSLLLGIAIILFLVSYCWVCAKTYLLIPFIALVMTVLTRYAVRRHREKYK